MTDRELLEIILLKVSAIESQICKIEAEVDEMDSEAHGFGRVEKAKD